MLAAAETLQHTPARQTLSPVPRTFVLATIAVPIVIYGLMPRLHRLGARLLEPRGAPASRLPDAQLHALRRWVGVGFMRNVSPPSLLPVRVAVAIAGAAMLVAGVIAVFATENSTGSATLVAVGAALVLAAGLWDRLESVEFAGAKVQVKIVERLHERAAEAEARGDEAVAEALREEAQTLLEQARPYAASYERLRESLAPGWERTGKLEDVVMEAKAAARRRRYEPREVRQLFGTPGNRIFALGLMEEDPRLRNFAMAIDAIEHSRSAFEQYHGLHLAELMLPTLTEEQRKELQELLTDRRGNVVLITEGTDRSGVARRILAALSDA